MATTFIRGSDQMPSHSQQGQDSPAASSPPRSSAVAKKAHESVPNQYTSPSSSTAGFFQTAPKLENQFHDDISFQRILALTLAPSTLKDLAPELSTFGRIVLSRPILNHIAEAEKNPPYLRTWSTFGVRRDELVTSAGWNALQDLGIREGMVAIGHEFAHAESSRVAHFAKYHLWCGSAAWVNCPSLMTDGVARLLAKHIKAAPAADSRSSSSEAQKRVLQEAYRRLVSRDPAEAWTTGQWMTERAGGSDVSKTETLARYAPNTGIGRATGVDGAELGPWEINGFKWFSSATDSAMTVLLARTPKGVSAFYAPMRRTAPPDAGIDSELNGITIQRLKQKLGTRALPTAELELKGMRAWLLGEEGRGTKEIATVLNIARIHNAVTAVGFWGRGLGIARAFSKIRNSGERRLSDIPAHMKSLARMHGEYRANMGLTFFVVALLGVDEFITDFPDATAPSATKLIPVVEDATPLLRLLTPVAKGLTAKAAISGLQECMESLGGVGYLENEEMEFNIARIYRDANVLSIWEGTTDMMAHDIVRVVTGITSKQVMDAMDRWVQTALGKNEPGSQGLRLEKKTIYGWWQSLSDDFKSMNSDELNANARSLMDRLGDVVSGAVLVIDALSDNDAVSIEVAERWVVARVADGKNKLRHSWKDGLMWDRAIIFGDEARSNASRL